jgi:hypothetical protein
LPLKVVELFAERICESFVQQTPSWFDELRAFNIDGTTMTNQSDCHWAKALPFVCARSKKADDCSSAFQMIRTATLSPSVT